MEFFNEKNGPTPIGDKDLNLGKYCTVFIAYFDEARGHQLLLIHPRHIEEDCELVEEESKTIFIHSIWWMSVELQDELSHVDLEFNGRNYMAKKFHMPSHRKKHRSGMDENTPETIVLMLSIPIALNPYGGDVLKHLYTHMTEDFKEDFSHAIEKNICDAKIIKSPSDKEVIKKGEVIIDRMHESISEVLTEFQKEIDHKVDKEEIGKPVDIEKEEGMFFERAIKPNVIDIGKVLHSRVRLSEVSLNKAENKINVTLVNTSNEDLTDCLVSIAYIEDFFEKYFYDVEIDYWFEEEELNFQFDTVGRKVKEEYMINITQGEKRIFQQKITTTKINEI
ncbi:MAG: hypothetical protein ACFFCS_06235 [Candidatus Hodarchaeota archaeon]